MAGIDELRRIAPPPSQPPPAVEWDGAEASLGVRFPSDYRALIDEWGAGAFDDFLWVFAPGHENPNLDLGRQAEVRLWALEETAKAGEDLPFRPRIVSGGLLPWGATDNADVCFWQLRDLDAHDSWGIAVNEGRGPEWHLFEDGMVDFLVAVLTGRERVSVFPEDVPSASPAFRRA